MAFEYQAALSRLVDGDTMDLVVDLGFGVYKKDRFRLLNVDTPEVYGVKKESDEYRRGMEAKMFVVELLEKNAEKNDQGQYMLYVKTHKDKKGKYGRYLAEVFIEDLSINRAINEFLETQQ